MAKVKDMEQAMISYFQKHADDAGVGLEILPGVKALLAELSVCSALGLQFALLGTQHPVICKRGPARAWAFGGMAFDAGNTIAHAAVPSIMCHLDQGRL